MRVSTLGTVGVADVEQVRALATQRVIGVLAPDRPVHKESTDFMKRSVLTLASFGTLALALAACGGGGGGTASTPAVGTPTSAPASPQNTAKGTLSFTVPIGNGKITTPGASVVRKTQGGHLSPLFVDGNTDGSLTAIFDGATILNAVNLSNPNGTTGAGPSGNGMLANGGTYSYTTVFQNTTNAPGSTREQSSVRGRHRDVYDDSGHAHARRRADERRLQQHRWRPVYLE